jgi:hypothetical protein
LRQPIYEIASNKLRRQVDVVDILKAIESSGLTFTAALLEGTYSLTDRFANTTQRTVVLLRYRMSTVMRINSDHFLPENAYLVADAQGIHPLFLPE